MKIKLYQQGGPVAGDPSVAAPAADPTQAAPQTGMEEQMAQMAEQLVQMLLQEIGDPSAVAAVLQMALEMLNQAAGAQQEPMFKKGGKLVKKNTKKACGGLKVR